MDTLARALEVAAKLIEEEQLSGFVNERYAGWDSELGQKILSGENSLTELFELTSASASDPEPVSGRQEMLENWVQRLL